jgi:hypothetical protein
MLFEATMSATMILAELEGRDVKKMVMLLGIALGKKQICASYFNSKQASIGTLNGAESLCLFESIF